MKDSKKPKRMILVIFLILTVAFIAITLWGNLTVTGVHYTISSERLPTAFENYKIAQISDLHNAQFGKNNAKIIHILKSENPDIIVITGDIVDSSNMHADIAVNFIQQAVHIAPCYYVTGNHEAWIGKTYDSLEAELLKAGVTVLHNEAIELSKSDETIQCIGLDDPDFTHRDSSIQTGILEMRLRDMNLQDGFKILLSHRPEAFRAYTANDIDLVFSGHAHGGQFRLPFIGGVVAPNQGFFPKYTSGEYHENNTTMLVSRGIGNSIIPIRINNPPEVVIAELHSLR